MKFERFSQKDSEDPNSKNDKGTNKENKGIGRFGKQKQADVTAQRDVLLEDLRRRQPNPLDRADGASSSAETLATIDKLIEDFNSLDPGSPEGKELQKKTTGALEKKITDTMLVRTGFQGELFSKAHIEDLSKAKAQEEITTEARAAIDKLYIRDTGKTKLILKVDSEKMNSLLAYLDEDPVRFPVPLEGFPETIEDGQTIRTFIQKIPFGTSFAPEAAIDQLKQAETTGRGKFIYEVPNHRDIKLEKHTADVGRRAEIFIGWLGKNANPDLEGVDKVFSQPRLCLRILMILHDLGKTLMQNPKHQDIAIMTLAPEILKKVSPQDAELIFTFCKFSLGKLYRLFEKGNATRDRAAENTADLLAESIIKIAKEHHTDIKGVANVCGIKYVSDAGSYPPSSHWFPLVYDKNHESYKFTYDENRHAAHDMLFARLAIRMREQSKTTLQDITDVERGPSVTSWMKSAMGIKKSTPKRVQELIEGLKTFRGSFYSHHGELHEVSPDLAFKYNQTTLAIVQLIPGYRADAIQHYRERDSKAYREDRHKAEDKLAAVHKRLENLTTDLEIVPRAIKILMQQKRQDAIKDFERTYNEVLDDYQGTSDKEIDAEKEQFRQQFITQAQGIINPDQGGQPSNS